MSYLESPIDPPDGPKVLERCTVCDGEFYAGDEANFDGLTNEYICDDCLNGYLRERFMQDGGRKIVLGEITYEEGY